MRVWEVAYPRSLVQFAYTSSLDVVRAFNGDVSDEERQTLLTNTIERIPANWEGYKTLFLRVKTTATRANWLAANVAAGSAKKSNAMNAALDLEQNPEIVYTRAADGTMVRTDNTNALLAANGNNANAALSFSPLYPDRVKGTEPLALNHDIHDLDVSHRVYCDANGYEYVAITFLNQADTGRPMKLDAYVYLDGDSEPLEVALPYYPDKTTDSYTHTVTLLGLALLWWIRRREKSM